jgi:hypothetical protein
MANQSIGNRAKPPIVMSHEPVAMYGARSADTIKARGHHAPHPQAGHMTAPDQVAKPRQQNPCNAGAVHT